MRRRDLPPKDRDKYVTVSVAAFKVYTRMVRQATIYGAVFWGHQDSGEIDELVQVGLIQHNREEDPHEKGLYKIRYWSRTI